MMSHRIHTACQARMVLTALGVAIFGFTASGRAEVRLPALFSHGAVLQRDRPVRLWGWAEPGEAVTASIGGQEVTVQADRQGDWQVQVAPLPAGGPHTLTVRGQNTVTVTNILVGEVWVASGQSNMQMGMNEIGRPDELQAADWPHIRQFKVPQAAAYAPTGTVEGAWVTCSPRTVGRFSAVGYFHARELHRRLGVPIGILFSAWGGTTIDAWISRDGLAGAPELRELPARLDADARLAAQAPRSLRVDDADWMQPGFDDSHWKTLVLPRYWDYTLHPVHYDGVVWARRTVEIPAAWAGKVLRMEFRVDDYETTYFNGREIGSTTRHDLKPRNYVVPAEAVTAGPATLAIRTVKKGWGGVISWGKTFRLALADDPNQEILLSGDWKYAPAELTFTGFSERTPSVLFNAMIAPLTPYTIRGAIWYQGEANAYANTAEAYRRALPALIRDWRACWAIGDFPFYYVQLPNFKARNPDPNVSSDWAVLRESQLDTLSVTNTGLAVTIDLGEPDNIHPKNKWDVGLRLAQAALADVYGLPIAGHSPCPAAVQRDGAALRVAFAHADGGLTVRGGGAVKGFALAGADRRFVWADAEVDGPAVCVTASGVPAPVHVRYAWGDNPDCNLTGTNGFPVTPFRASLAPPTE